MTDLIATVVVLVIVAAAIIYIVKAKKKGVKCIGCSSGECCCKKDSDCGCDNK